MILKRRTPGEPLVALALVLAGWVGARVLAWEAVFDAVGDRQLAAASQDRGGPHRAPSGRHAGPGAMPPADVRHAEPPARFAPLGAYFVSVQPTPDGAVLGVPAPVPPPFAAAPPLSPELSSPVPASPLPASPVPPAAASAVLPFAVPVPPPGVMPAPTNRIAVAGGHQMMWLAATAYLPLPPLGLRTPSGRSAAPAVPARRWSGDGWLLLRRGDGTIAPGPVVGNYGASQMGAVLRYRLVTTDPHRPAAYVRATAALNGTREQQVAAGLSARPLPRIPVTAMAELRQVRDSAGERLRPAVALVTELPPRRLPLGFTGELYAQAGYVGGRSPTAFVDGLVRAERPLTDLAGFRLRAGGGAWAAKQRGASRVDIGPTASLSFRLTDTASARLAADWRFRVGGRSKPDSGPALTLSAGF